MNRICSWGVFRPSYNWSNMPDDYYMGHNKLLLIACQTGQWTFFLATKVKFIPHRSVFTNNLRWKKDLKMTLWEKSFLLSSSFHFIHSVFPLSFVDKDLFEIEMIFWLQVSIFSLFNHWRLYIQWCSFFFVSMNLFIKLCACFIKT